MAGSTRNLEKRLTTILSSEHAAIARTTKKMWAFAACIACLALPFSLSIVSQSVQADETTQAGQLEAAESSESESDGKMVFQAVDADSKKPLEGVTIELQYRAENIRFNEVKTQTYGRRR